MHSPTCSPLRIDVLKQVSLDGASFNASKKEEFATEHGVTRQQVIAHHAVITTQARKIIRDYQLPMNDEELLSAFGYLYFLCQDHNEHKTALAQFSTLYDVKPEDLTSALQGFHEQTQTPSRKQAVEPTAVATSRPTEEAKATRVGGAFTDYEFPSKWAFRNVCDQQILQAFQSLSEEARAKAKILCLPSRNAHREIQRYLNIGFAPENIIAVEGGPKAAREEFLASFSHLDPAVRRRMNPVTSTLEEFLPSYQQRFTFVVLDFHNRLFDNIEVLQQIPLADRSFIITNFLASRENQVAQSLMRHTAEKIMNPVKFVLPDNPDTTIEQTEERPIKEIRDLSLDWLIVANIGADRTPVLQPHKFGLRRCLRLMSPHLPPELDRAQISPRILKELCADIMFPQLLSLQENSGKIVYHGKGIPNFAYIVPIAMCAAFGEYKCSTLKKYRYLSEASDTHSPFFSTFFELEFPRKDYDNWRVSASFARRCFETILRAGAEVPIRFGFTDKYYSPKYLPTDALHLYPDDNLTMYRRLPSGSWAGVTECSIDLATLMRDSMDFLKSLERYPYNVAVHVASVPRVDIYA